MPCVYRAELKMVLQTQSFTEPKGVNDLILQDFGDYSKETVIIASGNNLFLIGEVLGIVTASGKYAKYNDGATDGTEIAVAVSLEKGDATTADVKVAIEKRNATLRKSGLVFASGVDEDKGIIDLGVATFKISKAI